MGRLVHDMPKKGGKGGKKAKNADADVPTEQMIFTEAQDDAIDKKIDDKAKEQLQEINDMQAKINELKQGNNEFAVTADAKLSELRINSIKISESLSKLQLKVDEQAAEQNNRIDGIASQVNESCAQQQRQLESELADNQRKIDQQLEELHRKLTESIGTAKEEAIEESKCCCCTIL